MYEKFLLVIIAEESINQNLLAETSDIPNIMLRNVNRSRFLIYTICGKCNSCWSTWKHLSWLRDTKNKTYADNRQRHFESFH